MTQLDEARSAGTAKHFPGMMTATTLCFATKYMSFAARPRVSHCVADELPAPRARQKPWCRYGCDQPWCKGAGEGLPASTGIQDSHTVKCPGYLSWSLAEGWLDFGGQALTSAPPKREPFP